MWLEKGHEKKSFAKYLDIIIVCIRNILFAPGLIKFEVAHNANIAHTHHGAQTMAIANLFNCKLKMRDWKIKCEKYEVRMRAIEFIEGGGAESFLKRIA